MQGASERTKQFGTGTTRTVVGVGGWMWSGCDQLMVLQSQIIVCQAFDHKFKSCRLILELLTDYVDI